MEKKQRNKILKYGALALLLLLVAGLSVTVFNLREALTGSQTINTSLSSDLVKYRNKAGAETTEKALILSNYKALQAVHASDSSEIGRLQKLVKKGTISATIIKNQTSGTAAGTTTVTFTSNPVTFVNTGDSVPNVTTNPCDTVYPEYSYSDSTKWADISVKATKDSTNVKYKFRNHYEITQENKKTGVWPFRKTSPIVMVKNLNPHTETTQIASYAVQPPKTGRKTAVISGAALFIGILAGIFIAK